jgi:hypothetical protein
MHRRHISCKQVAARGSQTCDCPATAGQQQSVFPSCTQVQELLSDLQQAFAAGQEHFLGAIVTTRRGESPGEPYWVS